jgi:drug/metabolite transporter (DMT)-like permease
MVLFLSLLAAALCAVSNGVAVILEKVGADQLKAVTSSSPALLWRLRTNLPYLMGIVLDLLAWALTLYAVHTLPLFLVQPIIACSVLVTALVECLFFNRRLTASFLASVVCILVGLTLLALVSQPEPARHIVTSSRWAIIAMPLVLAVLGSIVTTIRKPYATYVLSSISGVAFGGVAVAGRAITFTPILVHDLGNPMTWATVCYGLVGMLFFTIALQRSSALVVNALMVGCETVAPIFIGLLLFGDHPRHSLWALAVLGILLTSGGAILIAF